MASRRDQKKKGKNSRSSLDSASASKNKLELRVLILSVFGKNWTIGEAGEKKTRRIRTRTNKKLIPDYAGSRNRAQVTLLGGKRC